MAEDYLQNITKVYGTKVSFDLFEPPFGSKIWIDAFKSTYIYKGSIEARYYHPDAEDSKQYIAYMIMLNVADSAEWPVIGTTEWEPYEDIL